MSHTETTEAVERLVEEFTQFGVHAYIPGTDDTEIVAIEDFFHGVVEDERGRTIVLKDWLRTALTTIRKETLDTIQEAYWEHLKSCATGTSEDGKVLYVRVDKEHFDKSLEALKK